MASRGFYKEDLSFQIRMLRVLRNFDRQNRKFSKYWPLLTPDHLKLMYEYIMARGDGDSKTIFSERYRWITESIEHSMMKYGANCLHPFEFLPLIDEIHNCKAEMSDLPDYDAKLLDVAYKSCLYVVVEARVTGQSVINASSDIKVHFPLPGIDAIEIRDVLNTSPVPSPILRPNTRDGYISPSGDFANPWTVSSESYQSGSEFHLPNVDKRDLKVIKSSRINAGSENAQQDASETADHEDGFDDFSGLGQESGFLDSYQNGLNAIRESINVSPSKPKSSKLLKKNMLVENKAGRVSKGPNHITPPSSVKRPGPALRVFEKAVKDVLDEEHPFYHYAKTLANKENVKTKSTPSKKKISGSTSAPGPFQHESAISPNDDSYTLSSSSSEDEAIALKVDEVEKGHRRCLVRRVEAQRAADRAEANRKSNTRKKKLIAEYTPPKSSTKPTTAPIDESIEAMIPKRTTNPYQAYVYSGSEEEEEYSPIISSSKRKLSDGAQPYEPTPSTMKKNLRTPKRPKTSHSEKKVLLSDNLDEDDEDPSFVSEAAKKACKRLRCRDDECSGGCEDVKEGVGEKRVTRSKTRETAREKEKKADGRAKKGKGKKNVV